MKRPEIEIPTDDNDAHLAPARVVAIWIYVIGTALIGALAFLLIFYMAHQRIDFYAISVQHFAAVIGLPLAALAAIFVVLLFRVVSNGNISIAFLGFKFEGASGPVILWVICFLAIVLGLDTLWEKRYTGPVTFQGLHSQSSP